MMNAVIVNDKEFVLSVSEEQIQHAVQRIASEIRQDLEHKNPLFIVLLNGAFMFAGDLFKLLNFPCDISFVKLSSYTDRFTSGKVNVELGVKEDIKGRQVVIIEDIVDTGNTLEFFLYKLQEKQPEEIKIASLLMKPGAFRKNFKVDYLGIEIDNNFIVGYGLDYNGQGRNLKHIYRMTNGEQH